VAVRLFETSIYLLGHFICGITFYNFLCILNYVLHFYCSEFCSIVRKIFIYTAEEVKKLSPKIGLPINEEVKPSKMDSEAVVNPEDQSSIVGSGC